MDALLGRPPDEDGWIALRRAVDSEIEPYQTDAASALAMTRLVQDSPALADRDGALRPVPLPLVVKATAALVCTTGPPLMGNRTS